MATYGYIHANVSGTDKPMTPSGDYLPFPSEKVDLVARSFRDGGTDFKHGMSVEQDQYGKLYYLCACAHRQTNRTSDAGGVALHAELRELKKEEFLDGALDRLLRFPFADEVDIVCGRVPSKSTPFAPVQDVRLESQLLKQVICAIIYGSLGRLLSRREAPVYVALPEEGFDELVRRVLKAVYKVMPYALRARSGYITFPNSATLPDGVTLCFIPMGWMQRFPDEPILTPLSPESCASAIDRILRSEHGRGLRELAKYLVKATPEQRLAFYGSIVSGKLSMHFAVRVVAW